MIQISAGLSPSNRGSCFPNMAGASQYDNRQIHEELEEAGVEIVVGPVQHGEVPTNRTGRLGPFMFRRAWYYWVVEGPVPLAVAEEIYADPARRADVRAGGDCGCRGPATWAKHYDAEGVELYSDPDGSEAKKWAAIVARHPHFEDGRARFVPDAIAAAAKSIVDCYHVDTQAGLNLFCRIIRDRGLAANRNWIG